MDNKILEEARDTMLTTLEKIGGQSLICSWTRRDGTVVRLSMKIMPHNEDTIADAICDMDDEEMARRLVPNVLDVFADGGQSEDDVRDWLELPESFLRH